MGEKAPVPTILVISFVRRCRCELWQGQEHVQILISLFLSELASSKRSKLQVCGCDIPWHTVAVLPLNRFRPCNNVSQLECLCKARDASEFGTGPRPNFPIPWKSFVFMNSAAAIEMFRVLWMENEWAWCKMMLMELNCCHWHADFASIYGEDAWLLRRRLSRSTLCEHYRGLSFLTVCCCRNAWQTVLLLYCNALSHIFRQLVQSWHCGDRHDKTWRVCVWYIYICIVYILCSIHTYYTCVHLHIYVHIYKHYTTYIIYINNIHYICTRHCVTLRYVASCYVTSYIHTYTTYITCIRCITCSTYTTYITYAAYTTYIICSTYTNYIHYMQ